MEESIMNISKSQHLIRLAFAFAILVMINVISGLYHGYLDLTEEKRYTFSESTERLLEEVDGRVYVQLLLDGALPADIKRLKQSTIELLQDFEDRNNNIEWELYDPNIGAIKTVNQRREELAKDKIFPQEIQIVEAGERTSKLVYPQAIIRLGNKQEVVQLIEASSMNVPIEVQVNNSIQLLEYKFAFALNNLFNSEPKLILFTEGHGELSEERTARLEGELRKRNITGRINLDTLVTIPKDVDLLIVAKPTLAFTDKDLFKIDQYLMNGGKILWALDKLNVTLQDINEQKFYVPPPFETNLEDILFKYGVRIQPNLILDLECTQIPQVIAAQGDKVQTKLFPWYYHPLVAPKSDHPIVKNIDRVNLIFPSTIDTLEPRTVDPLNIKKDILLSSSQYSRFQITPVRLNFEILKYPPDPDQFDKGPQAVAVLLSGNFESFYKNRLPVDTKSTLEEIGTPFKALSEQTSQIVISDGDLFKNKYNAETNQLSPIGYNSWEKKTFDGNRQFTLNCIEYLTDDGGLMDSRAKEIKLRPLDKVKVDAEMRYWQMLNLGLPIFLLAIFGFLYKYIRDRKYGR